MVHAAVFIVEALDRAFGEHDQLGRIKNVAHVKTTFDLRQKVGHVLLDILPAGAAVGLRLNGKGEIGFDHLILLKQ